MRSLFCKAVPKKEKGEVAMTLKIEYLQPEQIIPYEKNPKQHPKDQIDKLKRSIKEFGFTVPILIDHNNVIIAGHGRYLAAVQLDLKELPCIRHEGLTPEQITAYRIADNKLTESEWEEDTLTQELKALLEAGTDLLLTGFDESELIELGVLEKEQQDLTEDMIEVGAYERAKAKTQITPGTIIQLGAHRLMCGDSTKEADVARLMDGGKADLLLTDPPYGVNYSSKNVFLNTVALGHRIEEDILGDTGNAEATQKLWVAAFTNANNYMKGGAAYYCNSMQGGDILLLLLLLSLRDAGLELKHSLVWVKNNHVLGRSDYNYKHELILYGWKPGAKHNFYADFDVSVWEVDKATKNDLHPTMKPIKLLSKAINNSSREQDLVLDLFGGSGSTLIACEKTNRRCYMMELDPVYVEIICERWEAVTGKQRQILSSPKVGENI